MVVVELASRRKRRCTRSWSKEKLTENLSLDSGPVHRSLPWTRQIPNLKCRPADPHLLVLVDTSFKKSCRGTFVVLSSPSQVDDVAEWTHAVNIEDNHIAWPQDSLVLPQLLVGTSICTGVPLCKLFGCRGERVGPCRRLLVV